MERKREKEERKKGVKGREERGKERKGKSTAVLLDDAVLLRHSQQTEPYQLVELLECMQQRGYYMLWQWICAI